MRRKNIFYVYEIVHKEYHKIIYIGVTMDIERRWKEHQRSKKRQLYSYLKTNQYVIKVIDTCTTKENAYIKEEFWTKFFMRRFDLLNKTIAHKITQNEEKRIQSLTGRKLTKSHKEHIQQSMNKHPVKCIELNKIFESVKEASKIMKIHKTALTHHLHGRTKTCCGYHWKFV